MRYLQPASHIFREKDTLVIRGPKQTNLITFENSNQAQKALENFTYIKQANKNQLKAKTAYVILSFLIILLLFFNYQKSGNLIIMPIVFLTPNFSIYIYLQIILIGLVQSAFYYNYYKIGQKQQLEVVEQLKTYKHNLPFKAINNHELDKYFKLDYKTRDNVLWIMQILSSLTIFIAFNFGNSYYADGLAYLLLLTICIVSIIKAAQTNNQFGQVMQVTSFEEAKQFINQDVKRNVKLIQKPVK